MPTRGASHTERLRRLGSAGSLRLLLACTLGSWLTWVSPSAAQPAPVATLQAAAAGNTSSLEAELAQVLAEREDTSRLWPGLMIGVGASGVLLGAGTGLGHAVSCGDGDCGAPAWIGAAIVSGALIGALGTVWLVNTNHNLAQLDMRASMLQMELDRYKVHAAFERRELALGGRSPQLAWRLSF